ncbi:MAG: alpha/beta hydrolase [Alphaproteobacteria bacterium]|nr:alpha/beta hydrolase [Alphaproteobacteria bacterium]
MDRRSAATAFAAAAVSAIIAAKDAAADAQSSQATPAARPARPSFVETDDGVSLFYNDWGSGKPVLFTHAWSLNADIWEYQLAELSEQGLRCVAYDRRGHGRSTDPGRGYDYDRLADDLATVINQLDLHDVTLIGFSMGNGEAVRYLSRHGSARIARLVMVSTVPPQPNPGKFDGLVAALKQDRPAFFAKGVTAFTGGHPAVSPQMTEWVVTQFMRASPKATIDCLRAISRSDLQADLGAINVPTLIVHGAKDQVNPVELTAKMTAGLIPRCELKMYEDAPHGLVISHREQLTREILAFARS